MNILDENILADQRLLLSGWRVPFRQIGYEIGNQGMEDEEIIPLLLALSRPTLFPMDRDFYDPALRHRKYSLVYLPVKQSEAALFIRRVLRHRELRTKASRMGKVIRASHSGLAIWSLHAKQELFVGWSD
jgi:hypothetical protein